MGLSLSVHHLTKSFNGKKVLSGISFEIPEGTIFGLLGPNGAGKTTTIRILLDLIRQDEGVILYQGKPFHPSIRDKISYLPEERGLYRKQTVESQLYYFAKLKGLPSAVIHRNMDYYLSRLEIFEAKKKKVEALSKGMQQKIQFITSLVSDPELLILDEPFAGLDPVNVRLFSDVIKELQSKGKTIILSTHQMNLVEELCDSILMIDQGRAVLYGKLDEIIPHYAGNTLLIRTDFPIQENREVKRVIREGKSFRVELSEDVSPMAFVKSLIEKGAEIQSFEKSYLPLEEIFVRVVQEGKGRS
ncbi:MAG: ABC transporter ATP-binding protein [bacterium JZ-2024 1]